MKKYFPIKIFITVIVTTAILYSTIPLKASALMSSAHDQTIQTFINEIQLLQNQVFTLAQSTFEQSPGNKNTIKNEIKRINTSIQSLNQEILNYLASLPSISSENSDTLLVQNALNLVKNSLYQVDLLSQATSSVEQFLILQEFFRLRVNATETLTGLKNLISS